MKQVSQLGKIANLSRRLCLTVLASYVDVHKTFLLGYIRAVLETGTSSLQSQPQSEIKETIMTTATTNIVAAPAINNADLLARAVAGDLAAVAEIAKIAEAADKAKGTVAAPALVLQEVDPFSCDSYIPAEAVGSAQHAMFKNIEKSQDIIVKNLKAAGAVINKHGERLSDLEARMATIEATPKSITFTKKSVSTEDRMLGLAWDVLTGVALGVGVTAGIMAVGAIFGGDTSVDAPSVSDAA
jgi:hypothetical protein